MKGRKQLSTRRVRDYNYSQPGVHHVLLETQAATGILCTSKNGTLRLSDAGRTFLDVLGQALQRHPCIRIDSMSIRPSAVELVLVITAWRNPREVPPIGSKAWVHCRRTMTLPVFIGYLKTNSAMRINTQVGIDREQVWTRRYRSRILTEEAEVGALCADLDAQWSRVVVMPPLGREKQRKSTLSAALGRIFADVGGEGVSTSDFGEKSPHLSSTMVLGRVLFLTGAQRVVPKGRLQCEAGFTSSGRRLSGAQGSVIRSLGPDRLFLSG